MIPSQLKFSMEGATPSFADNEGQIVEAGSQVRLRIKGIRSELNQMYAIGSIREDYLGYEQALLMKLSHGFVLTARQSSHAVILGQFGSFFASGLFVKRVYHYLGLQRGVGEISPKGRENKKKRNSKMAREVKKRIVYVFHVDQDTQKSEQNYPEFKDWPDPLHSCRLTCSHSWKPILCVKGHRGLVCVW